jgi:carbamoyl-phosphate synthase large subunit
VLCFIRRADASKLALPYQRQGQILGTSPDAIDRAEDRQRFKTLLDKLNLKQPPSGTARSFAEAQQAASAIGYPVMVRLLCPRQPGDGGLR